MKLEFLNDGFIEYPENKFIEKVHCIYHGPCTVHYYHEPARVLMVECSTYNMQFGYPVSEDGRMLFVSSWENGLTAYDIATNAVVWRLKATRVKRVVAYSSYVVAEIFREAIVKLDINTGEILSSIRSGTIEHTQALNAPYIIVDRIRGRLAVVDTNEMSVVKVYKNKVVNPNNCGCIMIQDYCVVNNILSITGIESYPNQDFKIRGEARYTRVIDTNLYEDI